MTGWVLRSLQATPCTKSPVPGSLPVSYVFILFCLTNKDVIFTGCKGPYCEHDYWLFLFQVYKLFCLVFTFLSVFFRFRLQHLYICAFSCAVLLHSLWLLSSVSQSLVAHWSQCLVNFDEKLCTGIYGQLIRSRLGIDIRWCLPLIWPNFSPLSVFSIGRSIHVISEARGPTTTNNISNDSSRRSL